VGCASIATLAHCDAVRRGHPLHHISIDVEHGLIRKWLATDAAAYEGARLREGLLDRTNTSRSVWADTAYRSNANEAFMDKQGFISRVHRKKPKGRPMPETTRRANNLKSKVRSRVEHVFAEQKSRMGLFIRTIGIERATTKIGMANILYRSYEAGEQRAPLWQKGGR
jgi:IS5 family transposase